MPVTPTSTIWMDGDLVEWDLARVHVLTHALHHGTGVFEGIRAYATPKGTAVFRLHAHLERLCNSAKVLMMPVGYDLDELAAAVFAVVRGNDGGEGLYLRPLVYRGYGALDLDATASPVCVAIAAWPWGAYLGDEALARGVTLQTSTWRRHDPNSIPTAAKATGSYVNSGLALLEATAAGVDEAVLLSPDGRVSEASGENVFVVTDGVVVTPPTSKAGALAGITRDSVLTLARDLGYEVRTATLTRTDLYLADEMFLTGTAVEVTPVRAIDGRTIGSGSRGPVTEAIQAAYFAAVHGESPRYAAWLDVV
ncbi:MAG TPA: branched-chain amino acid transaminase [Acidimicrobiales bacterium]